MRTSIPVFALMLAGAALGSACRGATQARADKPLAVQPLSVTVGEVKSEKIETRVDVTGTLAGSQEALVSLEVEGRVAEISADLGDELLRGAVLARVTPVEFAWRKAQADADLAAAEADYKRLTEMSGKNLISQQQLDEGRRRFDISRAAADLADKKYSDTSLRAPFAGFVAKRVINAGEYVRVGTPAFTMVNANPLKLKAEVPERFAGDVRVGDAVQVFVDGRPQPLEGKVVRVGPAVALDTRSFAIEARVDNPGNGVKAGTFARAAIVTSTLSDAVTIPESAVTTFAGNPRSFVVEGDTVKEQPIELAGKSFDRVLVAKGLHAGQKVATSSVELLTDGRSVTVRDAATR